MRIKQVDYDPKYKYLEGLEAKLEFKRVCGDVTAPQAFFYLYRRFGNPTQPYDDYKTTASYYFSTFDPDIIVNIFIKGSDIGIHFYAIENIVKNLKNEIWETRMQWYKNFNKWTGTQGFDYKANSFTVKKQTINQGSFPEWIKNLYIIYGEYIRASDRLANFYFKKFGSWREREHEKYFKIYDKKHPMPRLPYWHSHHNKKGIIYHYINWYLSPLNSVWRRVGQTMENLCNDLLVPTHIRDEFFNIKGEYQNKIDDKEFDLYYVNNSTKTVIVNEY